MKPTIKRVLFLSRDRAEQMTPPDKTAIISISDTEKRPANLKAGWQAILRLKFDDLDPDSIPPGFEIDYDEEGTTPLTKDQAREVAAFIQETADESRIIVVHCRYGVSRSAGIAKAAAEHLGIRFPVEYDEYNLYVYRLVKEALDSS